MFAISSQNGNGSTVGLLWMDREEEPYTFDAMLFVKKKKSTDTSSAVNKPWKHAKWKEATKCVLSVE